MKKKTKRGGRYSTTGGREIYCDGKPFIAITREGDTRPVDADRVARKVAELLNKGRVPCKRKVT